VFDGSDETCNTTFALTPENVSIRQGIYVKNGTAEKLNMRCCGIRQRSSCHFSNFLACSIPPRFPQLGMTFPILAVFRDEESESPQK